jgi:uncharacterized RDD family membrane protein YckC
MNKPNYAGFWIRVGASLIDTLLMPIFVTPVITAIYGTAFWDGTIPSTQDFWWIIVNYILPAIVVVLFWVFKSATPGKLLTHISIVDAKTGGKPSTGQFIGRYLGYYVSMLPLFLGFFWVAFDKRKQGWHDKLAGTVVIRDRNEDFEEFDLDIDLKE